MHPPLPRSGRFRRTAVDQKGALVAPHPLFTISPRCNHSDGMCEGARETGRAMILWGCTETRRECPRPPRRSIHGAHADAIACRVPLSHLGIFSLRCVQVGTRGSATIATHTHTQCTHGAPCHAVAVASTGWGQRLRTTTVSPQLKHHGQIPGSSAHSSARKLRPVGVAR